MQNKRDTKGSRLLALDALRGLVIVFMALDHANFFIAQKYSPGEYWGGEFPTYADALPFLTRFVTHFCAPGFFFLMGVGMLLFAHSRQKQGWSKWMVIQHFLIRGGVLMALQLLVVNRAWELSPTGWELETYIGVLFALGGTMILGSLLLWLKPPYLLGLTAILLIGTELLVPDPGLWGQIQRTHWIDFLNPVLIHAGGDTKLWSNYPMLPWLELVTLGIVFGYWLVEDRKKAFRRALYLGVAFLLAFASIRALDGFGNIRPRAGDSWMDFLNPVKYPPSITFTLLTTGINLLLLRLFEWIRKRWPAALRPLGVFGQAPLFFYVLHLFLYAGLGHWLTPQGTSVAAMYPYWLLGVFVLFPLTLWYGEFKHRQSPNSILRFL
jgi:uncharacterized membrane protein